MKALLNWFDDRTGIRGLLHEALYERIPGGSRWRYVWGSTLTFAFVVQLITGLFLWMSYSPSGQTAWESVYYLQYETFGGYWLRGIHHFMAQAMIVLLALHLMQVVIDGAYRAPREINFWLGLILMQIVLGLSLTGYLLPWDQKGYWATRVATNLMSLVPVVGTDLQQLVVGGSDYGHLTLTRFFALHAGVLPGLLIVFLVLHIAIFRRHGIHAKHPQRAPDTTFWPDQVLKDAVACLAVLAVVLLLVFKLGADLGAPADPANQYSAARPEWYFLFLFQFLKYFHGDAEFYGAIVVPGAVMGMLFLMPILGRWRLGHGFNVALLLALLLGAGYFTFEAWYDDHFQDFAVADVPPKNDKEQQRLDDSKAYLAAVHEAEASARRAVELAQAPEGIPGAGAAALLRTDPLAQGPRLFKRYCATCHDHLDASGRGITAEQKAAGNLYGFASRAWIAGLLDPEQVGGPHYFGSTKFKAGEMVDFVKNTLPGMNKDDIAKVVIALSAEAKLPEQATIDQRDAEQIAASWSLLGKLSCTDCHKFHDQGEPETAPDLTGYGSHGWLAAFIANPGHARFYGEKRNVKGMPAFAPSDDEVGNVLTRQNLDLLVCWLRGDWYRPPQISAAP